MTVRDSTKAKRAEKEKAAIASLNKIKAAMAQAEPTAGDLVPFVIQAAEGGNDASGYKLMEWFIEVFVNRQTPHPLLQGYFAFCFAKILGDIDPRQALILKHKNGISRTAARDAQIVAGVEHLSSVRKYTKKKAMHRMAEIHFGDDNSGLDKVKNIMTRRRKSSLLRVKK